MPRFLQALEQEDNDYARHGIWLLLLMGLRCKELLKAKWEDIDWDMGTLFIGLTKNGEPLLAPISDAAMDRFKIIPRTSDNPYIICGRLRGQYLRGLGQPLRRTLKRAGLVNLRIHDLRRTVGSWLAQDGRSLHLIGEVLNHRDPKTTAGHAYFQTQQRRDALSDHGNRVLALTPAHLRKPAAPTEISAATLLPAAEGMPITATPNSAARHRHLFQAPRALQPGLDVAGYRDCCAPRGIRRRTRKNVSPCRYSPAKSRLLAENRGRPGNRTDTFGAAAKKGYRSC
jgi:hypothetical protein